MRTIYNKLVRDGVPDIIRRNGRTCATERLSTEAFQQALRAKLLEEAREAAEAGPDDLARELADVYEVLDALMVVYGLSREQVLALQEQRRTERGAFAEQLRLLWAE
jgi:predicted house-cleaning noncanonical NTP pyrophosphatase (MazG superfamily)